MSDTTPTRSATGGCLCGAVRYTVSGPLRPVVACHCSQCVRAHGHFVAYTAARTKEVTITGVDSLKWHAATERAERGFCVECGSRLFFRYRDGPALSIAAGSLDHSAGLHLACHIYTDEKPGYYELTDDLDKHPGASGAAQTINW